MDTTVLGNTTLSSYAFMYVKPKIYYSDHSADLKKKLFKSFRITLSRCLSNQEGGAACFRALTRAELCYIPFISLCILRNKMCIEKC